jgi:hypothetical protein
VASERGGDFLMEGVWAMPCMPTSWNTKTIMNFLNIDVMLILCLVIGRKANI